MKPTTPRRDAKRATVTMTPRLHARLARTAPAHGVSANRYCQIALEFLLDCDEAFGGPVTKQIRDETVARLRQAKEKFSKFLGEV